MNFINAIPLWVRKFLLDWVETAIPLLLALTLVIPSDLTQAQQEALVVAATLGSALLSAFRRVLPDVLAWLTGVLQVPPST